MSESLRQILDRGRAYIAENLLEACQELLEWQNTGLLRDGVMREAALILEPLDTHHSMKIAEDEVKRQAMEAVVNHEAT